MRYWAGNSLKITMQGSLCKKHLAVAKASWCVYMRVCVHVCDDPPCPKKNTYGQQQPQNVRISNNSISSLFQHKK